MTERATTSTKNPAPLRIGPVYVFDVHDADSFHVRIPLAGLYPAIKLVEEYTRVAHCNAAELSTQMGQTAKTNVIEWLQDPLRGEFMAHGWGRDNFGRWLMDLEDAHAEFLSTFILSLPGSVAMNVHEQKGP